MYVTFVTIPKSPEMENSDITTNIIDLSKLTDGIVSIEIDQSIRVAGSISNQRVKHAWLTVKATNSLPNLLNELQVRRTNVAPQVGDCVLLKVAKVSQHSRIFDQHNNSCRIFGGDYITGVLGLRYATDAFHAKDIDPTNLHILTNAGLIGTVSESHTSKKVPTRVELIGYLCDERGERINYFDRLYRSWDHMPNDIHPVFVVGTGMNSGKTTSTARLGQHLVSRGYKVAILKLTGSGCSNDVLEFSATGAEFVADFSDYGFPSTYLRSLSELESLYRRMLTDASERQPDVVLIEIADGIFQRETEMLLQSPLIRDSSSGVVLTALCSASAMTATKVLRDYSWNPICVTGLITNSPLFVQEFSTRNPTPVGDTNRGIGETCGLIMSHVRDRKHRLSSAVA